VVSALVLVQLGGMVPIEHRPISDRLGTERLGGLRNMTKHRLEAVRNDSYAADSMHNII
jgi:hypothetical protein